MDSQGILPAHLLQLLVDFILGDNMAFQSSLQATVCKAHKNNLFFCILARKIISCSGA
jgi:hypothetical protein